MLLLVKEDKSNILGKTVKHLQENMQVLFQI